MKKCEEFFLNNKPKFLFGAVDVEQFKKNVNPEVAFIGKSNVGKSSLINIITNSKICVSSKTPGRTKEINFFDVGGKITFVDMPGYGYAKVNKELKDSWLQLIYDYFYYDKNLKKLYLLTTCRKGLVQEDLDLMQLLDKLNINYKIIMTKSDNCNKIELQEAINKMRTITNNFLVTSNKRRYGIFEIRDEIYKLFFGRTILKINHNQF